MITRLAVFAGEQPLALVLVIPEAHVDDGFTIRVFRVAHRFTVAEYAMVLDISRGHAHRLFAAKAHRDRGSEVFRAFCDKFPFHQFTLDSGAYE